MPQAGSSAPPEIEVSFGELRTGLGRLLAGSPPDLEITQLHPPDLSGDGLGQLCLLDPAHPLESGHRVPAVLKDGGGRLPAPLRIPGQRHESFGDGEPQGVRRGNDGGLGDRRMLHQHRLQLEGEMR